ncbi:MAG: sugar transferase [Alphaproteobacteria bacterium]
MRNRIATNSEPVYQPHIPASAPHSPRKAAAKAQRKQQLASERIRDRIRLAKLERAAHRGEALTAQEQQDGAQAQPMAQPATPHAGSALQSAAGTFVLAPTPAASRSKRLFDFIGALAMLIALSPIMLALAFMVRRDGGPAIFGHRRIGSNGETFHCLKFRSMCVDAERRLQEHLAANPEARAEWERDFKLRDDPRVTPLGQFLRRTSLDELPQLINVIRGEMSLVGPRPIVADEVQRYGERFVAYRNCRPGITGLWQVSGRNDVSYRARVRLDSFYAARWSFAKDVFILVRTVGVVFRRSGAY